MITKITLKRVASYGETPAILSTDKRINLVYWLNGTGKTTISKYLRNTGDAEFSECSLEWLSDEKVLVYNEDFVSDNFYTKDELKGIFTLSKENREASEKIENAKKEIARLDKELEDAEKGCGLKVDLNTKKEQIDELEKWTHDAIWKIKEEYSWGDRVLEFCLTGKKGSKSSLFEHLRSIQKPVTTPSKSTDILKKEAESIKEDAELLDEDISGIDDVFSHIEANLLFQDAIVWNSDSQIAELIQRLGNADWVRKGLEYLPKSPEGLSDNVCPFCQSETITDDLRDEIRAYFDETYAQNIDSLKGLQISYEKWYQLVVDAFSAYLLHPMVKEQESEFKLKHGALLKVLDENRGKITAKISNPSQKVTLLDSASFISDFNAFLKTITNHTKVFNEKIRDREKTKKSIEREFWEIMRWGYDRDMEDYEDKSKRYLADLKSIETKIAETRGFIEAQKDVIKEAQKEIVNIDEAIGRINSQLLLMWIEGFSIAKATNNSYKLSRKWFESAKFKSLSEGEKTVISFLYFLYLCEWRESESEVSMKKIAVIDDPISSLSHIYVFNIAQLIRDRFFDGSYEQVFVLTHNLYFFHELLHKKKDSEAKLFRLHKADVTTIFEMDRQEIQNEYQSYWQIIKDYKASRASEVLLANAMRNILERFFGFINKHNFNELTAELWKDEWYRFFIRYMNKESHFDAINISDSKEIDWTIFLNAFEKVFTDADFKDHYDTMMG